MEKLLEWKRQKKGSTALLIEEFLGATGNAPLAALIRDSFEKQEALPEALHRKALGAYREYMLVGGMPRVVDTYARSLSCDRSPH